jgi:tetratricopeptide (TPR) repeat protein
MYDQAAIGTDSERTIARIWRVSLDRITTAQPIAADLLRTLAWYGPDAIPLRLCRSIASPPVVDAALGVLTAYSMITPHSGTSSVSLHRLVQGVARTPDPTDPHRSPEAVERAHTRAAALLHDALPDREDTSTWPTWRALLPHIEALVEHTDPDTATTAAILNATALFLEDQGLDTLAIAYLHRALAHDERVLGPDHPDTLTTRSNLGTAYESAGRITEAIRLHERTLIDRERVLGPDHPDTLTTRHVLALDYRHSVGRLDEAIPLHERALIDRERVLGPDHTHTMITRSNLGTAYEAAGRIDEAIPLHERALADRERVLGPDHPYTVHSRNNLARAYRSGGRIDEAVPLYERTLADCERFFGPNHTHTLTTRNNLSQLRKQADSGAAQAGPHPG